MENLGTGLTLRASGRRLTVAVVGGGWAGCASAVELARRGHQVILLEASRTLGGRARKVDADVPCIDNGQHILLGAYRETLRLMRIVAADCGDANPARSLLRLPLQMPYPAGTDGMHFAAPLLPAPLHFMVALLSARGIGFTDKLSVARFHTTARWMDWTLNKDCSVSELLERFDQTDRIIRLLWRPLCLAALNTPPERASAQIFLNVLRDSIGARASASHMLLPRTDLSAIFPEQASRYLSMRRSEVRLGTRVNSVQRMDDGWTVACSGSANCNVKVDAIVMAAPSWQARTLLAPLLGADSIPAFAQESITTCYLQYSAETRLSRPFFALADQANEKIWGQFVFDRGQLDSRAAGLMAVVVSASEEAASRGSDVLTAEIATQLANVFGQPGFLSPIRTQVITEKRATWSCTPGLQRPANDTGIPGLWLAGDYTDGPYPATIESAVRSGVLAAAGVDAGLRQPHGASATPAP